MPSRRRARVIAFQVLYEVDTSGHELEATLDRHLEDAVLDAQAEALVRDLVTSTIDHQAEVDARIMAAAPAWPLDQMARIDKAILRLAVNEVLFNNEAPVKVAINEAVELAKIYGADNSPRFINGVLGSIVTQQAGTSQPAQD